MRLHHVPVLIEEQMEELSFQDLTVSLITPLIDGTRHVKKICDDSQVNPELGLSSIHLRLSRDIFH